MKRKLRAILFILPAAVCWLAAPVTGGAAGEGGLSPGLEFGKVRSPGGTADHSKFKELKQEFKSGPEVTRACLTCHTEAASQVHKTLHWTWRTPEDQKGVSLGKAGYSVNNFCISLASNEPRCTSCHAGYGWKDKNFDLTAEDKVDCLVCHEQTGSYKKFPTKAGLPVDEPTEFGGKTWNPPDFVKIAQSVARPNRRNCGECHFFGGGGEGVKHGDLDASLFQPDKELDVHMAAEGLNFTCTRCHSTEKHRVSGRAYEMSEPKDRRNLTDDDQMKRITCYSCHSEKPHKVLTKANDHTDKVACQTCHIPAFARKNSTKMYWDWSTAGKRDGSGKPVVEVKDGRPVYDGMKGNFRWEKNVTPEYFWYNEKFQYLSLKDAIDPAKPVLINRPEGSYADPDARIYPFKVHRGKQPYDVKNRTFVVPHLFGKDDNAYWKTYDWDKSVRAGMEVVGLPYSGEMGFVETEYLFQTTHMVAPKAKALSCAECHTKNGRLEKLTGFYMPGRDSRSAVDFMGWGAVFASCLGVTGHGLLRYVRRKK